MNTIGFPIPQKENEKRRALIPGDVAQISTPEALFFEKKLWRSIGLFR